MRRIFERHPNTASDFRPKKHQLKKAYIGVLLDIIGTLCRSPHELNDEDLDEVDNRIFDLEDVGFKLDWLKMKQAQESSARIRELQEEVQKQKLCIVVF